MKLNKQGVRDLNDIVASGARRFDQRPIERASIEARKELEFGKNQLPGEMAAKLLAEKPPAPAGLTPEQREFLYILAEECGEVIQRITKVLRFGADSRNPWNGRDNLEGLDSELGDIHAAAAVLAALDVVNPDRAHAAMAKKLKAFAVEEDPTRPRVKHMSNLLRQGILAILEDL